MPSTSMPAQTVRLSRGSTMMLVVRGVPMGQSMLTPMSSLSQDLPPSRERKPSGRVPAKMVSVLDGSMATDQTCRSAVGLSTLSQLRPLSSLRNRPRPSEPARMRWGLPG